MRSTILRDLCVAGLSIVGALIAGTWVGMMYTLFFPTSTGGGWVGGPGAWELVIGFPLALIFLLCFLFTLLGSGTNIKRKLTWLLALPIIVELLIDPLHIYLPITLALIGYGLGLGGRIFLYRK